MVGPARGAGTPRPVQHDRPTESPNRDSTEPTGPPIRQLDQTAEPTDPPTRPDRPGRQLDRTANPPTAGPPTADPRTRPTVHTSRSPLVPAARLPPHLTSPSNLARPRPSSPPRREWPGSRTHAHSDRKPPPRPATWSRRSRARLQTSGRAPTSASRTDHPSLPPRDQRQPRRPTAAASANGSRVGHRQPHQPSWPAPKPGDPCPRSTLSAARLRRSRTTARPNVPRGTGRSRCPRTRNPSPPRSLSPTPGGCTARRGFGQSSSEPSHQALPPHLGPARHQGRPHVATSDPGDRTGDQVARHADRFHVEQVFRGARSRAGIDRVSTSPSAPVGIDAASRTAPRARSPPAGTGRRQRSPTPTVQ